MANMFETVLSVLRTDERFVATDGTFLRNKVYEAAMSMEGAFFASNEGQGYSS